MKLTLISALVTFTLLSCTSANELCPTSDDLTDGVIFSQDDLYVAEFIEIANDRIKVTDRSPNVSVGKIAIYYKGLVFEDMKVLSSPNAEYSNQYYESVEDVFSVEVGGSFSINYSPCQRDYCGSGGTQTYEFKSISKVKLGSCEYDIVEGILADNRSGTPRTWQKFGYLPELKATFYQHPVDVDGNRIGQGFRYNHVRIK